MKVITPLLLSFVTLASAFPSPGANSVGAPISARQECTYDMLCNADDEGEGPDPDTARCCALVGGSGDASVGQLTSPKPSHLHHVLVWWYLTEENKICNNLAFTPAENFARCCGRSGGYTFFAGPNCPPISV